MSETHTPAIGADASEPGPRTARSDPDAHAPGDHAHPRGASAAPARRAVMKGITWTVPTAMVTVASPALAVSKQCPSKAFIDSAFAQRKATVGDYKGCAGVDKPTFTIWYDGPGGRNGYLQTSILNVRNENACTINTTAYPLAFRVDIVNLSGPDGPPAGKNSLRRSLTATNSYGFIAPPSEPGYEKSGIKNETYWELSPTRETVQGAQRSVYSALWTVSRVKALKPKEDMDLQVSWGDGLTRQGRLTNAYRVVPLGVAPPEWGQLTTESPATCPDAYAYYEAKAQQWYEQGLGCTSNIQWRVATNVTATNFDSRTGYSYTPITCAKGIWSVDARDFTPTHDGIY